jgi:2-polyprenyl-6-hydroxyphenyl methylase / 3-demethylubiquinone-9 3-methyltransferase
MCVRGSFGEFRSVEKQILSHSRQTSRARIHDEAHQTCQCEQLKFRQIVAGEKKVPCMQSTIDEAEVARFEQIAAHWWDGDGPMRALHRLNPLRVAYLRDLLRQSLARDDRPRNRPLAALRILDIGCGGGLLAEPLARLGAAVTGIDPAAGNVAIARAHAKADGLAIDYRDVSAETLARSGVTFDAVVAMEVVEHVKNMPAFVKTAAALVRPGGLFVAATLNRTLKSFALAIVGAEYLLGWLPKGTHRWEKFVTPAELGDALSAASLTICDQTGVIYHPLFDEWRLANDMDVNYMIAAERRP